MAVPAASSADEATALALSCDCVALACGDPDPAPWGISGRPPSAGTEQPAWNSSNALSTATVIASTACLLGIPSPRTSGPAEVGFAVSSAPFSARPMSSWDRNTDHPHSHRNDHSAGLQESAPPSQYRSRFISGAEQEGEHDDDDTVVEGRRRVLQPVAGGSTVILRVIESILLVITALMIIHILWSIRSLRRAARNDRDYVLFRFRSH
jgi:hypothetical protein